MNDDRQNLDAPTRLANAKRPPRFKTLADGLESRRDNFLLLRFIAATLVIYGHGAAVTGGKGWPELFTWLGWGTYSGTLAVYVFFVISGFMIAGSYLRRQHLLDFLWARILRIYPAYLVCLILCAFVLGALYTTLPIADYFRNPDVSHYVIQNLKLQTGMVWDLPGVFKKNPLITVVNGAIWTLPAEFRMYLWIALVGIIGVLSRRWVFNALLIILFGIGISYPQRDILMIPGIFLHLAAMFGFGAFCYVNRRFMPVGWPYAGAAALAAYLLHHTELYPFAFGLALAEFTFAFAYCIPWHGFNRFGDYSYGIYLWGFPMQQVIAHYFPALPPIGNALPAFFLALALAILSWHLIERPALKLKNVPRRIKAGCIIVVSSMYRKSTGPRHGPPF